MSRREIPSFAALQAFDAAARHLSFTKAAEELFLTQSAISRQVQALEESVGTSLFRRAGNRLVLTDAGQHYRDEIAPHLEGIRSATVRLMAFKGVGGRLRLCVLPTLGMKWLVPRLPAFLKRHPEVQVELSTRVRPPEWADSEFDAAIQHGEPARAGIMSVPLMGEELVVVASPDLARARLSGTTLVQLPLLQQSTRPAAWANWFEHAALTHANPYGGLRFEQFSHVIQGAIAGLGLALVPHFLVRDELESGTLKLAWPATLNLPTAYHLAYPESRHAYPALMMFRDWIRDVARQFGV